LRLFDEGKKETHKASLKGEGKIFTADYSGIGGWERGQVDAKVGRAKGLGHPLTLVLDGNRDQALFFQVRELSQSFVTAILLSQLRLVLS